MGGEFCIYSGATPTQPGASKVWCGGSRGGLRRDFRTVLQSDGNLCTYYGGQTHWCLRGQAAPQSEYTMRIQTDANLCIRDANGGTLWCANSVGHPCLPRGRLPLKPVVNDANMPLEAWVPAVEKLLTATGVTNHAWEGIEFRHSSWVGFQNSEAYWSNQAGLYWCFKASGACCEEYGAVDIRNSTDLSFTNSTFASMGNLIGLSIGDSTHYVKVS